MKSRCWVFCEREITICHNSQSFLKQVTNLLFCYYSSPLHSVPTFMWQSYLWLFMAVNNKCSYLLNSEFALLNENVQCFQPCTLFYRKTEYTKVTKGLFTYYVIRFWNIFTPPPPPPSADYVICERPLNKK